MDKKILVIGLICNFLIAGLTTTSAAIIKSEIISTEVGQIICHVFDKDASPGTEPPGIKNIKLVLKNDNETLTLHGITDDKGQYAFINLNYGLYKITAYGSYGYSNKTIEGISLRDPELHVTFELTKKSRSRYYISFILLELFQDLSLLSYLKKIL